ncbi:PAS domain S-box protein [Archangium violaceum]|uniref:sensor histidine kinase n=1 Tax=Archangium violaceum TaxID=83451 RepID=UPI002B2D607A|nr:PAS domain S-box protein [Archangium violaceum]
MILPDFLDAQREELIERWARRAERLILPRTLPRKELVNSLPVFLGEISGALRHDVGLPGDSQLPQHSVVAEEHGQQRLRLGLDIEVIPEEYGLIHECLLDMLEEAGQPLTSRQARLLVQCIQTGTSEAMSQYVRAARRREQQLLEEAQAGRAAVERALADVKRANAALRESEERFRLMVHSVLDYAVFMLSVEGRVNGWNPGAERLKRYKAEEVVGTDYAIFFPAEQQKRRTSQHLLEDAASKGGAEYEGWMVRKGGSRFWGTLIINPVRDDEGRLKGFCNIARDLTERKQSEEAQTFLAEVGEVLAGTLDYQETLQEVAQLALRALADWCVVWRLEGKELRPAAVAHLDVEKGALLKASVRNLPADTPATHGLAGALSTGAPTVCSEARGPEAMARELGLVSAQALEELGGTSYVCIPLKVRGETFGAIALVASTSELRYGPAAVHLAEDFSRRAALALENARLYGAALERVELEQHLAGIVSHDLSTPIHAIGLGAEMLLKDKELTPNQRRTLERIHSSSERARRMTRDLLDFTSARLGGRLRIYPKPLNLHELARGAVEELATANPQRTLERVHTGDGAGVWDADRLTQLLTNLVNNALTYSPPEAPVLVETRGEDESVLLRVKGGRPIPAHLLPRLFQPLERGQQSSGGRSIGLGLFIVDHIVRAHGGSVSVHSTEEEGTTVTVRLPRYAGAQSA